jgi:hypothetical protein
MQNIFGWVLIYHSVGVSRSRSIKVKSGNRKIQIAKMQITTSPADDAQLVLVVADAEPGRRRAASLVKYDSTAPCIWLWRGRVCCITRDQLLGLWIIETLMPALTTATRLPWIEWRRRQSTSGSLSAAPSLKFAGDHGLSAVLLNHDLLYHRLVCSDAPTSLDVRRSDLEASNRSGSCHSWTSAPPWLFLMAQGPAFEEPLPYQARTGAQLFLRSASH